MILWYPPADTSTSNPFIQMKTLTLFFFILAGRKESANASQSLDTSGLIHARDKSLSSILFLQSPQFMFLLDALSWLCLYATPIDEFVS